MHRSRSRTLLLYLVIGLSCLVSVRAEAHILRFTGVAIAQGRQLQTKFPFVFEREVTLAEVDEVVRYLMQTGFYSNIDVVERQTPEGPELLLAATTLRKIKSIAISGNRSFSTSDIKRILKVDDGITFERKELIESVKELQGEYRKRGFRSMNAEIDFQTPSETEVVLVIAITEGVPVVVDKIQVDAANPDAVERGERIMRSLRGKALDEEKLQEAVQNLTTELKQSRYITSRVLDPQPSFDEAQSRVRLNVTIENAWRFQFRFEGNGAFDADTLIRSMSLDQLVGTLTTPSPELVERLRRFYQSRGYAHVEIEAAEKVFAERFVKEIVFEINEGPRVRVKRIEISGNISRPGEYYSQFIRSRSSDIIGAGYYNRKDIEEGIQRLEEEMQNQGYLRAKVKSWRSEFSNPLEDAKTTAAKKSPGSQATLILNIDEGPLTVIRQIRFEGVESFSKLELQDLLPIKTGESLRIKNLNAAIEELKTFYQSKGYVEIKILNEQEGLVTYNENSTQATVEFQIAEGPKVTVGTVVLEGNTFTKDYVILRELGIKPGDVYTPELREDATSHLQKLELFSRVNIKTLEEGTSISERTVIVEIEEKFPGTFESGVGVVLDRDTIFRGYVGTSYRNLWGTGRGISIRGDPSYSTNPDVAMMEYKLATSYLEPYVFRDRNKGRLNFVREVNYIGNDQESRVIIKEENAFSVQLERELARYVKGVFTVYSLSSQTEVNRRNDEILRTQNIAKVGPLIEYDSRDNVFYPTRGWFSQLTAEYSDPALGSSEDIAQSIKFSKFTATISAPYRIAGNPRFILATALRGGYLANLSELPQGGVPNGEAFFLGGRSTIRGYQPVGAPVDLERVPNIIQLGGGLLRDFYVRSDSSYVLFKTELRFPVYGDLHGAFFYDGGAVFLSQVAFDDPYRDSAGAALRLLLPGGFVFSFDYGFKLDRKQWRDANGKDQGHEAPGALHLSIGTF